MAGKFNLLSKNINECYIKKPFKMKVAESKFIDLSHTIEHGLITYKGLPAPIICDYLSRENSKQIYEAGTSFQNGEMGNQYKYPYLLPFQFYRFEKKYRLHKFALSFLC